MFQLGYPKEIVAALIGDVITNDIKTINDRIDEVTEWFDRGRVGFMAACDFGTEWKKLAEAPTLFCIGEDGNLLPANAREQGNNK